MRVGLHVHAVHLPVGRRRGCGCERWWPMKPLTPRIRTFLHRRRCFGAGARQQCLKRARVRMRCQHAARGLDAPPSPRCRDPIAEHVARRSRERRVAAASARVLPAGACSAPAHRARDVPQRRSRCPPTREGARVGRRDGADQVVDARRGLRPVDAAVLRRAAAEVAAAREVLRRARRVPSTIAGSERHEHRSAATVDLVEHLARGVVGQDGHGAAGPRCAPASGLATISCSVAPVSVSPISTAQLTGARPRYFGSSEPCMLNAPRAREREDRGRQHAPVIERKDDVGPRSPHALPTVPARSDRRACSAEPETPRPCRRRCSNQIVSPGSSRCVTTSGTSTPRARSTRRQRSPTL